MKPSIDTAQFLAEFSARGQEETWQVDIGGHHPIPIRTKTSPNSRTLVVLFHGALNRRTRKFPEFLRYLPSLSAHAHQMSLADPSLLLSNEMTTGWFIGSRTTPLQQLLPDFFRQVRDTLCIDRLVFAGGSSGGFAALYYSWAVAGSVAVAWMPQTNIDTYFQAHRERFVNDAWGDLTEHLPTHPCFDLREVYQTGMNSTVVFLQSMLDTFHLQFQMMPFLASIPQRSLARLALQCSYWGKPGHGSSIPSEEWKAWVHSAVDATNASVKEIVASYDLTNPGRFRASGSADVGKNESAKTAKNHVAAPTDSRDIALTDRLVQQLLRNAGQPRA